MSPTGSLLFTASAPALSDALRFQLDWYGRMDGWELILVEQGDSGEAPLLPPGIVHRRVRNPGPFSQAWGFNLGARIARGGTLFFIEPGVLVGRAALERALKICRTQAVAADLFHRLIPLDGPQGDALRDGRAEFDRLAADGAARGEYPGFCAGGCAIDRQTFERLGGFDERLLSAAQAMEGMALKLERSGGVLARFDNAPARRLAVESVPVPPESETLGRRLLLESARQSPAAFHFTCEVQRQLMGNGEKFGVRTPSSRGAG